MHNTVMAYLNQAPFSKLWRDRVTLIRKCVSSPALLYTSPTNSGKRETGSFNG